MRLKKKYVAVIVVVMVVLTAILASFIVNSVQGTRIAYVAVNADKASYEVGENVTFKLRPLSQGVQFTVSGTYDGAGVHIVRVPDDVDPGSILTDYSMLSNLSMWENGRSNTVIPIPQFNSTGEPLELSWNGTISAYEPGAYGMSWGNASAGYYVLYPRYNWEYGHSVKFIIDESSIFYFDSLKVKFNVTYGLNTGNATWDTTITADLTLPDDGPATDGVFHCFVPGSGQSDYSENWHNASVVLKPGVTTRVTIAFSSPSTSQTSMDSVVRTPAGDFVFGFWQYGYSYYNGPSGVKLVQY